MTTNRAKLLSILQEIKLENNKLTLVSARNAAESVSIDLNSLNRIQPEGVLDKLQQIIYTHYNACPKDDTIIDNSRTTPLWMPGLEEQRIQNDNFWDLESVETNNTIIARKHSERVRVPDGSYYKFGEVKLGDKDRKKIKMINAIHIVTSRQTIQGTITNKDDFNYITIYGKYILKDETGEDTIRFYFNLCPEPIKSRKKRHNHKQYAINRWKEKLMRRLNDRAIPFNLKYLSSLQLYNRSDAGVLYIQKHNFNLVAPIVLEVYNDLIKANAIRKSSVPLFTHQIKEGLGFAESPSERETSFGMSVAKGISQAIVSFLEKNKVINKANLNDCLDHILDAFTKDDKGNTLRDVEELYLNVGSKVSYDFGLFNNKPVLSYQPFPGKARYLRASSFFANILREKAITINGQSTWITYDEIQVQSEMGLVTERGFRLVNDLERQGIQFFLENFDFFVSSSGRKPSEIPVPNGLDWEGSQLDWNDLTLNEIISQSFDKDNQEKVEKADMLIQKYVNIKFPLPNGFSTFEFCPTLTHGLACLGYFFLYVHSRVNIKAHPSLPVLKPLSDLLSPKK
ncbi:T3SS effector HopA1 family protein [Emticicia sp. 17c]|uniref:T3SS effector HopA1 family protein n=1 Tax=Emticicia sp. 17c TaxID=3127704 RepID=UPI00301C2933